MWDLGVVCGLGWGGPGLCGVWGSCGVWGLCGAWGGVGWGCVGSWLGGPWVGLSSGRTRGHGYSCEGLASSVLRGSRGGRPRAGRRPGPGLHGRTRQAGHALASPSSRADRSTGPSSGCRVQMGGAGLARPPGATDGVALDPQTAPEPRRPERRRGEIRGDGGTRAPCPGPGLGGRADCQPRGRAAQRPHCSLGDLCPLSSRFVWQPPSRGASRT